MQRWTGRAVWVVLAAVEAVLVGAGAIAITAATANPPGWSGWLAWVPTSPLVAALVCLGSGVGLAVMWVRRGRRLGLGAAVGWATIEAGVVGVGAIAINVAAAKTPAWPDWLHWVPIGPVPTAVGCIGAGIVLAGLRARPARTHVRRVWAVERADPDDIPRPALADQVLGQLITAEGGTVGLTTALVGAGGFGKTTMARLVCADPRVRRRFRAGVWITLGQDIAGGDLANKINDVYEQLTGTRPGFTDPDQAGQHLGDLLERGDRVLLVIDDVWRGAQLRPFLHTGRRATRLVTTRRPDALPATARDRGVRVDELDSAQSRQVLTAGLPPIREAALARLLRLTGRWPLLLRLTNAHLRTVISAGVAPDAAATRLADRLDRDGPDTLSLTDEVSRDKAAAASINASLDLLAPTPDDPVDGRRLFEQLAVFAEDSDIDRPVLQALWRTGSGLSEGQVDRLCERLAGLSLVADYQPGWALRLHDVVRAYLRAKTRDQLPALNATLVNAGQGLLPAPDPTGQDAPPAWWRLPQHADYLWQHLCEHLTQAGRHHDLTILLQDLRWAEARIRRNGPAALDADFAHSPDTTVATLRRAIGQNAHHFTPAAAPVQTPWLLADQLLDRLYGTPGLEHTLNAYRRTLPATVRDKPRTPPRDRPDPALQRVLTGHTGSVGSCAIAPDGTWLVTTSDDHVARIWDAATGALGHTLTAHTDWVLLVAIARDGTWLVTTSHDGSARIWDAATGALRHTLTGHTGSVRSCAIAPDGTWLVTTSHDGSARIWDAATGALRRTLTGHTSAVGSCAIAPDGTWLVTTGHDATARIWDAATGALRRTLTGHTSAVGSCAIAPDGTWLVTTSSDATARIWDAGTGALRRTLTGHTRPVWSCAIAPEGTWLVTTSYDRTARVWDAGTGALRHALSGHTSSVLSCAIAPDGTWLVTTSYDHTARIWDAGTGALRHALYGHTSSVLSCAIAPDGTWLVTTSYDHTARIWDAPRR
jgi:WD40 repeat protein